MKEWIIVSAEGCTVDSLYETNNNKNPLFLYQWKGGFLLTASKEKEGFCTMGSAIKVESSLF